MANINKNELTKEQIERAMDCETVEELIKLAKDEGITLTKEEAEAYMAELADFDLDDEMLNRMAGGAVSDYNYDNCHNCPKRTCSSKNSSIW